MADGWEGGFDEDCFVRCDGEGLAMGKRAFQSLSLAFTEGTSQIRGLQRRERRRDSFKSV